MYRMTNLLFVLCAMKIKKSKSVIKKYGQHIKYPFASFFWQTIKIWDFETGTPIFEYGEAHGDCAITCMTFDKCGRR